MSDIAILVQYFKKGGKKRLKLVCNDDTLHCNVMNNLMLFLNLQACSCCVENEFN